VPSGTTCLLRVSGGMFLELRQLPAGSPTLEFLPRLARDDGYLAVYGHAEDSPYLRFSEGWESYTKQLSRNHRARIRKDSTG